MQFYVDVFQKHKLSSPNSPQSTDEEAVEQLIRGQKSIVHADILNRGTLLDKLPEQMADGTIVWGPHFPITGGNSGSQTFLSLADVRDRPPGGRRRRDQGAGGLGVHQGVVPAGEPDRLRQDRRPVRAPGPVAGAHGRARPLRRGGHRDDRRQAGVWSNHPRSVDFQYNLLAPHGQKMLQGAPVADELAAYADEVNAALKG